MGGSKEIPVDYRKFQLNIRKKSFCRKGSQAVERIAWGGCGVSIFGLGQPALVALLAQDS